MTYGYKDIGEKPFCKISEHTVITLLHYRSTNLLKMQQKHYCTDIGQGNVHGSTVKFLSLIRVYHN